MRDEQATDVMRDLEYLDDQGSHWDALITHLYQMHKLRDKGLWLDLCSMCDTVTWLKLQEMYDDHI